MSTDNSGASRGTNGSMGPTWAGVASRCRPSRASRRSRNPVRERGLRPSGPHAKLRAAINATTVAISTIVKAAAGHPILKPRQVPRRRLVRGWAYRPGSGRIGSLPGATARQWARRWPFMIRCWAHRPISGRYNHQRARPNQAAYRGSGSGSTRSVRPSRPWTRTRCPGLAPGSQRARHGSPLTRTSPMGWQGVITRPLLPTSVSGPTCTGTRRKNHTQPRVSEISAIAAMPTAGHRHGSGKTKMASRTAATRTRHDCGSRAGRRALSRLRSPAR